ncbi:MAG: DM13 domain-containing protein [Burkholderiales bacterium]
MKKTIVTFLVGGMLGAVAGFAAGIFIYPFIFLADIVAEERVEDAATRQDVFARKEIATGMFVHANPSDPIHYGKGKVTVYNDLVHLESDFEVGPGPKYHVYLVPEANVTPITNVEKTMFVDLGRLKAFRGSQNYPLPDGIDLGKFGSVVIWCEHFATLISPATLKFD